MPYYTHDHTNFNSKYNHLYNNSNHPIPHIQSDIYHDSIFALNYMQFYSVNIYTRTIQGELKIIFHLPRH